MKYIILYYVMKNTLYNYKFIMLKYVMQITLHEGKMNEIASITNTNLTETQLYSRIDEISLLSNLLKSTEFNSSLTILLTGIRGVGKTALIKKIKNKFDNEYLVVDIDLSRTNAYQQKNLTRGSIIKIILL